MQNKHARFLELEGLRGIAAVVVAFYHYFLAFYVLVFLGVGASKLYGNPIMVFLSGTFSVAIFFVLSGFVLSVGFFQTDRLEIVKKLATKRYFRLMIPALASILIAFTLLSLGLSQSQQAATLAQSSWLIHGWGFIPNIFGAVTDGFYGIFVRGTSAYNNVLWTMTTEFLGSFIVFGFLALFGQNRNRKYLYIILGIVTFNSWLLTFMIGMLLADLYAHGTLRQVKRSALYVVPMLVIGLFLAGYPLVGAQGTIYAHITAESVPIDWNMLYLSIGATLVVIAVLTSSQLAKIFAHRWVSWLGKYTFSLYLIHLSILYTFTSFMFIVFHQQLGMGYNKSAFSAIAASIPVVAAATYLFERYIDARAIQFSSWIASILLGDRKLSPDFLLAYEVAYARAFGVFAKKDTSLDDENIFETIK